LGYWTCLDEGKVIELRLKAKFYDIRNLQKSHEGDFIGSYDAANWFSPVASAPLSHRA
jgi:hypothetical protein